MRRFTLFFILVLALSLALVACGGDDGGASEPAGEASASRGEELYKQTAIGAASAPGCITCHSVDADIVLVGPPHVGIATEVAPPSSVTEYRQLFFTTFDLGLVEDSAEMSTHAQDSKKIRRHPRILVGERLDRLPMFFISRLIPSA